MPQSVTPSRPARFGGFTLIEVMVALFILALMSAMAWQGVDAIARSRESTQLRMDRLLRLQTVLAQWEADVHEVIDTQVVPGLNFDGATLRLTRRQPEGVQVVAWTLRSGTLYRWSAPTSNALDTLQDGWMRSYQLLGNEPGTLAMLENIAQWQLFVFLTSSNGWSNAQSSGDVAQAPPAPVDPPPPEPGASGPGNDNGNGVVSVAPPVAVNHDALPDGLRMVIGFAPGGAADGTLTREVRLIHP
ncbi:prepilin-type N-terminal cleavage/methylation domain-containing protein [Sphaerotilus sp.]|uniref:PulJ/GspJ family protein n=1 Tax=Sphaerotilus sp. TaxID=2093942 RepID=UPI00286E8F28|nr:prepilin-type N-terminal cleavage/methylation domain-containing protein [Sphaerotilus sp.]